jgi:hypothetical protein
MKQFQEEQDLIQTAQLQHAAVQRVAAAMYLLDLVEGYTTNKEPGSDTATGPTETEIAPVAIVGDDEPMPAALPMPVVVKGE